MEIAHPTDVDSCSTWLEIDLEAIRNNIRILKEITATAVMPVVKANAYGHGLIAVSKAAEEAGAPWLGVSRIEEAVSLRKSGIKSSILILGYTPPKRIPEAIQYDIAVTLYDPQMADFYNEMAAKEERRLRVHVKTDSGMGRLGVPTEQAGSFLELLSKNTHLQVEALFTHFARADEPAADTTDRQMERFLVLLQSLEKSGTKPKLIHASNSAGALNYPGGRFDMVRCGIAVYGLNPSPETTLPASFRRSLSWKTRLTSIKMLPPGHGISYGHHYYTRGKERIGVIAIGYADGFRRTEGNRVLIHGKETEVIGAVCMDQCMVRLDDLPEAEVGDEVTLIGEQKGRTITADNIAARWGTINYEVVCGLADRVPRFYQG